VSPDRHARTMLPIPDRPSFGLTTYDAKDPDTAYPPIEPLVPPEGAPNVLIILLDDVGFGASSTFGGPRRTPTADRLAAGGLRYNRFHATALLEFAYNGGGLAKGGNVTLYYDGTEVGTGRVGATQPLVFSADETTDIGYESGTTVTSDYSARDSRFTGKISWVQIDLDKDDHDHFIDPEERLRVAMSRQ
jgi:hypothetical protein